jgi:hypothetical protein
MTALVEGAVALPLLARTLVAEFASTGDHHGYEFLIGTGKALDPA